MIWARLLIALALVFAFATPPRAHADDAADRASGKRHFQLGEQHFQRGEFAEALREYEAGYRVTRLPGFIINIAHCHRLMGDLRKARAHYRRYLLVVPASPRKAEVEEMIATLDRSIASQDGDAAAPRPLHTPSVRWWLWSALASSLVGSTVATMALAASEERQPQPLVDAPASR
jgi:tetratricopeptide (TPR) repeat protein